MGDCLCFFFLNCFKEADHKSSVMFLHQETGQIEQNSADLNS